MNYKEVIEIMDCYGIPCSSAQLCNLLKVHPEMGEPKKALGYSKPDFKKSAIDEYIRLKIGTDRDLHRVNLIAIETQREGVSKARWYDTVMRVIIYKKRLFTTKKYSMLCINKSDLKKVRDAINDIKN